MTSQPSLIPHVPLIKLFLPSGSSGVVIKREAKAEASLGGGGVHTRGPSTYCHHQPENDAVPHVEAIQQMKLLQ